MNTLLIIRIILIVYDFCYVSAVACNSQVTMEVLIGCGEMEI